MEIKKIIFRARQFGGLRLSWTYMSMGLGILVIQNILKMLLGFKTKDEAYAAISYAANRKLQLKYKELVCERKVYYDSISNMKLGRSNKVFVSWLQGFEGAPELVKVCVESIKRYMTDREIILLSLDNYHKYAELPNDIVEKFKAGKIPPALFSDLLRLELLIKYGGTWMDATILCTGEDYPKEIIDCDLFVFQAIVRGDARLRGISNWFITACQNNRLLMVLRDVLIQYWRDYDCTIDYYIFHHFFYSIAMLYPDEIAAMPRKDRLVPLQLMKRMGDKYDENWMKELKGKTCFHKLNYRLSSEVLNDSGNFYHTIIKNELSVYPYISADSQIVTKNYP